MPSITLPDGATINYRDDSFVDPWRTDVETIVMLHGFCRNSAFWYAWVPTLARRYRVVRWDARGCGESTKPPAGYPWTLRQYHRDLSDFLDALGLDKVHIVGESMGGMVSPYFANWYPERVISLTVCSPNLALRGSYGTQMAVGQGSMSEAIKKMSLEDYVRATEDGRLDPQETPQGMRDWYRTAWPATGRQMWEEWSSVLVPQIDLTAEVFQQIRCPVLYIAPSDSPRTSLDEARAWIRHIPHAKLVTVEARSQGIEMAKAEECAALTLEFLQSLPVAAGRPG